MFFNPIGLLVYIIEKPSNYIPPSIMKALASERAKHLFKDQKKQLVLQPGQSKEDQPWRNAFFVRSSGLLVAIERYEPFVGKPKVRLFVFDNPRGVWLPFESADIKEYGNPPRKAWFLEIKLENILRDLTPS